ncbi:MAG: outer membrane protein assembly factor BamB [Janthinobacterium lividum]
MQCAATPVVTGSINGRGDSTRVPATRATVRAQRLSPARQGSPLASVAAGGLVLALLAGCSSLNPFASKVVVRNPPAALTTVAPTITARTVWSASVGKAGPNVFSPAAVGDSVYAAASNGTIVRLDAATGREIWKINAGVPLSAGVGTDGAIIAVGAANGTLLTFSVDGKPGWKAQLSSEILSAPAVGQGLVIVRSLDNRIAGYDVETGTRRWLVQRTAPSLILRSAPGISITGQNAFVALPGGRLLALATSNGGPRWEATVGDPRGTSELERIADVSGMPASDGSQVCAAAYQGRIACFDNSGGNTNWSKEFSSSVGVGMDGRYVYGSDERGNVNAFTREAGTSVWRNSALLNRGLSAPTPYRRSVVVGDYQGYIHFLSREDGALMARLPTDGSPVLGTPVVSGSNLIFQTQAGTVAAFAAE